MKQEEITLSELCAMSAYKTVCKGLYEEDGSWETRGMSHMEEVEGEIQQIYNLNEEDPMDIYLVIDGQSCHYWDIKPYLRPKKSMTEEEKAEYKSLLDHNIWCMDNLNYLYSHHIDFGGWIEKGLALEAPSDMYK